MSAIKPSPILLPHKRYLTRYLALLSLLFYFFLAGCNDDSKFKDHKEQALKQDKQITETALEHAQKHLDKKFICPMHPQIVRDAAGRCPVCGMDLVAKEMKSGLDKMPVVSIEPHVAQNLGVQTVAVKRGKLWKYIKTVGYVRYNERRLAHVRSGTAGWVENLGVRTEGQVVKKGQLLMELYSPEFLATQKEFIEAQKKDKSGTLKPYGKRAESIDPRDRLRYMDIPESTMNEIARTGKPRHRIPIYSPQYGVIVRHGVKKHMFVWPDYTMFSIADLSSVWVEAHVFEHQIAWVQPGQQATFEVQAIPGRRFEGMVNYIYPELDPRTRTLKVRLLIPNPEGLLKPNMFTQVRIFGGPKEDVVKIPRVALIATGERESVVLARGEGKFQPVDVITGMQSQGEVEIVSGLQEGDRVVTSGQFLIDSEANLQASFLRFNAENK